MAVTCAIGPREMRSPAGAHRGAASVLAVAGPGCAASAASTGAPRLRTTASTAVAPKAATVAIRQPKRAPARIAAPLLRSARTHTYLHLSAPVCLVALVRFCRDARAPGGER